MQKRSNRRIWTWLILFLVVFVLIGYFLSLKKPREYTPYVSESPAPMGVKAIFTYVGKEKKAKRQNRLPVATTGNDMLVMIGPYFTPESEEMESYYHFLEAGNTILLFKENPADMFGISTEFIEVEEGTLEDAMGREYEAEVFSPVRLVTEEHDTVLLSDDAGVVAVKRSIGDGQLIVAVTPHWMTNGSILSEDHVPLVISLLNEGNADSFIFDEYIHGEKGLKAQLNYYPMWFLLLMLQLGVISILWLWYRGKRFGSIYSPLREDTVRFSDEGIKALAAWYIRGRRYRDSLNIQADYLKQSLQEHWRIPYREEWKDLGDYFERKWPKQPREKIVAFLQGLTDVLAKEKVSKHEYLYWSKQIDRIRKEVEEN